MANKKTKGQRKFDTQVYNRKIIRNMLKRIVGSNRIRGAWHRFQKENKI